LKIKSKRLLKVFISKGTAKNHALPQEVWLKKYEEQSAEFFKRFNNSFDFKNKSVLDFGCGWGVTCFEIGKYAKDVTGLDINEKALIQANEKLEANPSATNLEFTNKITKDKQFDIIISKDCFEHYSNPELILDKMKKLLKPGGQLVIGFSGLWNSPIGGHLGKFSSLPWLHVIFDEGLLLDELRRYHSNNNIKSFNDTNIGGLNQLSFKEFLNILKGSELKIDYFKV
jgi:SAM-dependent methyltransferase